MASRIILEEIMECLETELAERGDLRARDPS
jgi:hypothetical protein